MTAFITYVYSFFYNIYSTLISVIENVSDSEGIGRFYDMVDKQIIGGTLFNVGITWRELLLYGLTIVAIFGFIIFIFKLVYKVIGLICLR